MMKKYIFIFFIIFSIKIQGQKATLEGKVASKGTPVVANVLIKDSTIGTLTNFDGEFSLQVLSHCEREKIENQI